MFIKTRREPWHGAADAGRKRYGAHIHRDGAKVKALVQQTYPQ